MADRGDTHYRVSTLNGWFLFSSAILLVASVWMMWDDYDAPWKPYQEEFRELDLAQTRAQLESMQAQQERERELRAALDAAEQASAARSAELKAAQEELFELEGGLWDAERHLKINKGLTGWNIFVADEQVVHDAISPEEAVELVTEDLKKKFELELVIEDWQRRVQEKEDQIAAMTADVREAEQALKDASKDLERLRTKIDRLDPEGAVERLANFVRDVPGIDFVDPNNKVRKVVCPEIKLDLNFTKKPRIDMCMTCHMGIDRAGFEDAEQPYRTHPRLDLFLTAKSPHPMNRMGCTACHGGSGEALDFQRADHRPTDEAEGDQWYEEYHWHKQHHWDYPMLSSRNVEAGCVQCHTTSMELIADEAPTLTEGYRLFEESGCYSCHKVEWFPTTRRRGPSLRNLTAKLPSEFLDAWIAKPKDFRPTTRMPQIFHLENFSEDQLIVKSEYGKGREMFGGEWSDAQVASVSAYLIDSAKDGPAPAPMPLEGDAHRGREEFRVAGCLACHNIAPYDPEDASFDPATKVHERNDMGPNLRGVATKIDADWLYWWILDPQSYWPDTRMPNLRLEPQDAADITAYITEDPDGIFTDVPESWDPQPSPSTRDVLVEQARWLYARAGRTELERRLSDEWSSDEALKVAVGRKWIEQQGCFSCHEINGLEAAQPIGTELTTWGSKTVDKLDFGFLPHLLAEENGWDHHTEEQFKKYREPWLENKLHNPRIYDRLKFKNPLDRLRMPYFGFTDDQVEALVTFVVGMVNDDVEGAKMMPDADQAQSDAGMRAVRQNNCAACHLIEPGTITYTDEDGGRRTVRGELLALEDEVLPPPMHAFAKYLADYEAWYQEDDPEFEVEELIVRLLAPEPDLGLGVGDTAVIPAAGTVVEPPHGGEFVRVITDYYMNGMWDEDENSLTAGPEGEVMDVDGEARLYSEEPYDKVRWTFAPPVLLDEGGKLQREWFYAFLNDPEPLREQLRVRMPSFKWDSGEAGAIADWFALKSAREWPASYTRRLRGALELSAEAMADELGIKPAVLRAIEDGAAPETRANFAKVLEFGARQGYAASPSIAPSNPHPSEEGQTAFSPVPPVDPGHERLRRRELSYLNARLEQHPDLYQSAEELARGGPNCFQCHFYQGVPPLDGEAQPIAWAPDLFRVQERIREDWAHQWLKDPSKIYPGTAMPANFSGIPPAYQEFLSDSTNEDQIQIVLDWLFNMDRAGFRN